eukprot:scaffold201554_cov18-Tisochrysis_lutea.AAC.1
MPTLISQRVVCNCSVLGADAVAFCSVSAYGRLQCKHQEARLILFTRLAQGSEKDMLCERSLQPTGADRSLRRGRRRAR